MLAVENSARDSGMRKVVLTCFKGNTIALSFYKKGYLTHLLCAPHINAAHPNCAQHALDDQGYDDFSPPAYEMLDNLVGVFRVQFILHLKHTFLTRAIYSAPHVSWLLGGRDLPKHVGFVNRR